MIPFSVFWGKESFCILSVGRKGGSNIEVTGKKFTFMNKEYMITPRGYVL